MKEICMPKHALRLIVLATAALLTLGFAACGGSDDSSKDTNTGAPVKGKKGGTLKVLFANDFEHTDPGEAYYQPDYMMVYATSRPLFSFEPQNLDRATPDFAAAQPTISDGGKTVTIKLKPNVKFSPPVNRAATSKDVKYAIERAYTAAVPNGYVPIYFAVIDGVPEPGQKTRPDIKGIQTPDDQTLVFKLKEASGAFVGALSLPVTAPVPQEYAEKFDSKTPSLYGNQHAATGPYMVKSYQVGKSMTLVRNPNWDPKTDYRPAYADEIDFTLGNEDTTVASRQILNGKGMINGDFVPDPPVLKQAVTKQKSQVAIAPLGNRFIGLNNTIPPLDDINVRKAINAATDRNALILTRGGPIVGDVATHFLAPTAAGFAQAGGMKGPGVDFLANPDGDLTLAKQYLAKASPAAQKALKSDTLLMVGDDTGVGAKTGEVFQSQLQKLGIKVNFRQVPHDVMYSRYCNVPKSKTAICPNVGWLPDFPDGQAWLDPTFNGAAIVPENNSNWAQLNNPKVNAALDGAKPLTDVAQRAQRFAEVDKMVTELAAVVPWIWDKQANISSGDVQGVIARWNAQWDLNYTFIK
jgi:peptide/nickel transport system substrate-binding protein